MIADPIEPGSQREPGGQRQTTKGNEPAALSSRNGHGACLLCGDRNSCSLNLRFILEDDGAVHTRLQSHRILQGFDGIVHGGAIAALLDAAMTHCLFHHGVAGVTGDLHVRFLHSIPLDEIIDLRAWILASAPRLFSLRAELTQNQRIAAWAEAKFIRRRDPREG
jgi:acyl-coenzyme A thioesterase PaaI-like protein